MKGRNQAARWECGGFKAGHEASVPRPGWVTHKSAGATANEARQAGSTSALASACAPIFPRGRQALAVANVAQDSFNLKIRLVR